VEGRLSNLTIEVVGRILPTDPLRGRIVTLCEAAYGEDFSNLLGTPLGHVLGWVDRELVSHASWVQRELAPASGRPLRTAYVEAVATAPNWQQRGFASDVLRRLAREVTDSFELAALSPSDVAFYERLGWQRWRGPLAIRSVDGLIATPGEDVMVLRLTRTPHLDLDSALTAEWREGELW